MRRLNILVLLLFISLTSCIHMVNDAAKAIQESAEGSSESLSEDNYKTVEVDTLYQLSVPKYMKEMKDLHPEASLEYANIYKEAYSVVIHENKEEFINVFTGLDEYDETLSPVLNYSIVQKKMFDETIENFKYEDYGLTEINSYPAKQIKVFGKIDGIDFAYIIAFIEGKDNIYMIMNWTDISRFNKLVNTFEYINGTFKLL